MKLLNILTAFFSPPPPPPPDPTFFSVARDWLDKHPLAAPIVSLGVISLVIGTIAAIYIRKRWRKYFDAAVDTAFKNTDVDNSGCIDQNELYVGVLELYLQLHLYGLNVRHPPRSMVMAMMAELDTDQSGTINKPEFKKLLEGLVTQTFSRVCVQVGLTIVSPLIASYVSWALRVAVRYQMSLLDVSIPSSVVVLFADLPSSLDETIITTVLMLSVNPALALSDAWVNDEVVKKIKAKTEE